MLVTRADIGRIKALHVMNRGTSRNGLLAVISLMAVLEVVVALSAMYTGDISERVGSLLNTTFASIGGISAVLLLVLRMESVKETVESVDRKADRAAVASSKAERNSAVAAERTTVVEQKVEAVRHDITNDVLVRQILRAIRQAEADPEIQGMRVENVAKGVQKDRHDLKNREAGADARAQMEERVRRRIERGVPEHGA